MFSLPDDEVKDRRSGRFSGDSLSLPVGASPTHLLLILVSHLLGLLALILLNVVHAELRVFVAIALVLSAHHAIRGARLRCPDSIVEVRCFKGRWRARTRDGRWLEATLSGWLYVGRRFIVVPIFIGGRRRSIVLASDVLTADQFRRARVFFRFASLSDDTFSQRAAA